MTTPPTSAAGLPYDYPVYLTLEQAKALRDHLDSEIKAGKEFVSLFTPRPVGAVMNALGLGIKPTVKHAVTFGNSVGAFTFLESDPDTGPDPDANTDPTPPVTPIQKQDDQPPLPVDPIQKHP